MHASRNNLWEVLLPKDASTIHQSAKCTASASTPWKTNRSSSQTDTFRTACLPELLKKQRNLFFYYFSIHAYEVVTGNPPYKWYFNLSMMIKSTTKGERPVFAEEVAQLLKDPIEKCMIEEANMLPSFSMIYAQLSSDPKSYSKISMIARFKKSLIFLNES